MNMSMQQRHQQSALPHPPVKKKFDDIDSLLKFISEWESSQCTKFINQRSFADFRAPLKDLSFGKSQYIYLLFDHIKHSFILNSQPVLDFRGPRQQTNVQSKPRVLLAKLHTIYGDLFICFWVGYLELGINQSVLRLLVRSVSGALLSIAVISGASLTPAV